MGVRCAGGVAAQHWIGTCLASGIWPQAGSSSCISEQEVCSGAMFRPPSSPLPLPASGGSTQEPRQHHPETRIEALEET